MRRRTLLRRSWPLGVAAVVALAFVAVWFQPHKLWIDDRVSEPEPASAGAPPDDTQVVTTGTVGLSEVGRGRFVSREHHTSGLVRVIAQGDGRRTVRFEGLDTSNGPDLYVYLSANRADGPEGGFDDDYVSLGRLKGNQGDQNYEVPADVDLTRLRTVVIWCDRFNAVFGAADLASG